LFGKYRKAGRGALSESRYSESSEDVTKGKGRDTKASEIQSVQGSEKALQHSGGTNRGLEMSAAQMRPGRVKRSPSYSEAISGHVIASPGQVAHVSSEHLESEPGHLDQLKVAKPDKVAHSRTCSGASSGESDPRFANHAEVGSQQDVSRKEDRLHKALPTCLTPNSARSLENHVSTFPKSAEGGETNLKIDSLQFFSQDQSFQVAPTQVKPPSDANFESWAHW